MARVGCGWREWDQTRSVVAAEAKEALPELEVEELMQHRPLELQVGTISSSPRTRPGDIVRQKGVAKFSSAMSSETAQELLDVMSHGSSWYDVMLHLKMYVWVLAVAMCDQGISSIVDVSMQALKTRLCFSIFSQTFKCLGQVLTSEFFSRLQKEHPVTMVTSLIIVQSENHNISQCCIYPHIWASQYFPIYPSMPQCLIQSCCIWLFNLNTIYLRCYVYNISQLCQASQIASGADDPITRWDMRLPMDAAIYRGLVEILGKRSGEEAPKILYMQLVSNFHFSFWHDNFHVSPQLGELLDLCIGQWLSWNGQGVGAALEELVGPDAELWELGVVVTEPGAVPRTGSWSSWGTAWIKWNVHRPIRYFSIVHWLLHSVKLIKPWKWMKKDGWKTAFLLGRPIFRAMLVLGRVSLYCKWVRYNYIIQFNAVL